MPAEPQTRTISADFNLLEERDDLGLSVLLGPEDALPELQTLTDGEHVCLLEAGNLQADGIVTSREYAGRRYWYAKIASRSAIQDIHPTTLAEQHREQHREQHTVANA
ncbi:MAG TPA: hypothetical protein VMV29_06005 [Ktedonobacterales bacterium]|nr:hypothetical protein [Ktedonobacterales bacterium]